MSNQTGTMVLATGVAIFAVEMASLNNGAKPDNTKYGKEALGFGLYMLSISFIAGFAGEVAYKLSVLVLVTFILLRGEPLLKSLQKGMNGTGSGYGSGGSAFTPGGGFAGGGGGGGGGGSW